MDKIRQEFKNLHRQEGSELLLVLIQENNKLLLLEEKDKSADNEEQKNSKENVIDEVKSSPSTATTTTHITKHSDVFKKEAAQLAVQYNNNSKATSELKIKYQLKTLDKSSIREWIHSGKYCTKEESSNQRRRWQTRDLRSKFPELDNHIKDTIKEKRQKKLTINFKMI